MRRDRISTAQSSKTFQEGVRMTVIRSRHECSSADAIYRYASVAVLLTLLATASLVAAPSADVSLFNLNLDRCVGLYGRLKSAFGTVMLRQTGGVADVPASCGNDVRQPAWVNTTIAELTVANSPSSSSLQL